MKKIVIYSQNGCPYCDELKNMLQSEGIDYSVKDIDDNKDDWGVISEHSGVKYVPTVLMVDTKDESGRVLAPDRDFDGVDECLQHIMTDLQN
tara:strand:- start:1744 stop:2019 length:276 start_codon:yes stop_codon:yes gene_type:complete